MPSPPLSPRDHADVIVETGLSTIDLIDLLAGRQSRVIIIALCPNDEGPPTAVLGARGYGSTNEAEQDPVLALEMTQDVIDVLAEIARRMGFELQVRDALHGGGAKGQG